MTRVHAVVAYRTVAVTGFLLRVAGGQTWSIAADDVQQASRERWGAWVTPSYRFDVCSGPEERTCQNLFEVMVVLRVLGRAAAEDGKEWDFGGRLLWQPTEAFNLSAEFLRRRRADAESSERTVALVEYRIRQGLALFGSFGKDFVRDSTDVRPLVSLFGLSFGLGTISNAK